MINFSFKKGSSKEFNSSTNKSQEEIEDSQQNIEQDNKLLEKLNEVEQKLLQFQGVVKRTNSNNFHQQIDKIMFVFSVFDEKYYFFKRMLKNNNINNKKLQIKIDQLQILYKDLSLIKNIDKNNQDLIMKIIDQFIKKFDKMNQQNLQKKKLNNNKPNQSEENMNQKNFVPIENDNGFNINDFQSNLAKTRELTIIQEVEETQFESVLSLKSLNKTGFIFGSNLKLNSSQLKDKQPSNEQLEEFHVIEEKDSLIEEDQKNENELYQSKEFISHKNQKEQRSSQGQDKKNYELQSTKDYEDDIDFVFKQKKNSQKKLKKNSLYSVKKRQQIQLNISQQVNHFDNTLSLEDKSQQDQFQQKLEELRPRARSNFLDLNLQKKRQFKKSVPVKTFNKHNPFKDQQFSIQDSLIEEISLNQNKIQQENYQFNNKIGQKPRRYSLNRGFQQRLQNKTKMNQSVLINKEPLMKSTSIQQQHQKIRCNDRKLDIDTQVFFMQTLDNYTPIKETNHRNNLEISYYSNRKNNQLKNHQIRQESINQRQKKERQQIDKNYKKQVKNLQQKQKSFKTLLKQFNQRENKLKDKLKQQYKKNQDSQRYIQQLKQKLNYYDCKLQAMKLTYKDLKTPNRKYQSQRQPNIYQEIVILYNLEWNVLELLKILIIDRRAKRISNQIRCVSKNRYHQRRIRNLIVQKLTIKDMLILLIKINYKNFKRKLYKKQNFTIKKI